MNERARAALRTENTRLGSSRQHKVAVDSAAPVPGRHRGSRARALALGGTSGGTPRLTRHLPAE